MPRVRVGAPAARNRAPGQSGGMPRVRVGAPATRNRAPGQSGGPAARNRAPGQSRGPSCTKPRPGSEWGHAPGQSRGPGYTKPRAGSESGPRLHETACPGSESGPQLHETAPRPEWGHAPGQSRGLPTPQITLRNLDPAEAPRGRNSVRLPGDLLEILLKVVDGELKNSVIITVGYLTIFVGRLQTTPGVA